MKKKLLFLIALILSYANIYAQCSGNVSIPDANFKAALLSQVITLNINSDNEISCAEAEAFTGTLYVHSESISDLTGIEAFVNITGLYCNGNSLTSLNLSSNTALKILDCHENSLTDLDISSNVSLENLYCNDMDLTSLNLSSNSALKNLFCQDNDLTALDVSSNTALETLTCSNNSLTSIDVSSNTALETLHCSGNLLTNLNIANGNNANFLVLNATSNASLTCIQVDNATEANANTSLSTFIDSSASFSENCSLSTTHFTADNFNIYINPEKNILTVKLQEELQSIIVYNVYGQKLLTSTTKNITVGNLSAGVYLVKVTTTNGKTATKRIVKE